MGLLKALLVGLALVTANASEVYEPYEEFSSYPFRSDSRSGFGLSAYDRGHEAQLAFDLQPGADETELASAPAPYSPSFFDGAHLDAPKLSELRNRGYSVKELGSQIIDSPKRFGGQHLETEPAGTFSEDGAKLVESENFEAEYPELFKQSRIVETGQSFLPSDGRFTKIVKSIDEVQKSEPVIEEDHEEVDRAQIAPIIRSSYEVQKANPIIEKDHEEIVRSQATPFVRISNEPQRESSYEYTQPQQIETGPRVVRVKETPIIQKRYEVLPAPIVKKYVVKTQPIIQKKFEVTPPNIIKKYYKVQPPQVIKKLYKYVAPPLVKKYFKVLPPPVIRKTYQLSAPPVVRRFYNVQPRPVVRNVVNMVPPPVIQKYFKVVPPPVIQKQEIVQRPQVIQRVVKVLPPPIIRPVYTPPPIIKRVVVRPEIQPAPIVKNVYVPRKQEDKHYLITPPAIIKNVYNVVKPEKVAPPAPPPEPQFTQVEVEEKDLKKIGKVLTVETVRRVVDAATFENKAGYTPPPARTEQTVVGGDGTLRKVEKYVVYENVPIVRKVLKTVPVSQLTKGAFLVSAKTSPVSSPRTEYLVSNNLPSAQIQVPLASPAPPAPLASLAPLTPLAPLAPLTPLSPLTPLDPLVTSSLSTSARLELPTPSYPLLSSAPSFWAPSSLSLPVDRSVVDLHSLNSLGSLNNFYSSGLGQIDSSLPASTRVSVSEPFEISSGSLIKRASEQTSKLSPSVNTANQANLHTGQTKQEISSNNTPVRITRTIQADAGPSVAEVGSTLTSATHTETAAVLPAGAKAAAVMPVRSKIAAVMRVEAKTAAVMPEGAKAAAVMPVEAKAAAVMPEGAKTALPVN